MFGFLPFWESGCCYVKKHELCHIDVALIQTHLAKSSYFFFSKNKTSFSFVLSKFLTFFKILFLATLLRQTNLSYCITRSVVSCTGKNYGQHFFFVCVLSCLLVDSPTPIIRDALTRFSSRFYIQFLVLQSRQTSLEMKLFFLLALDRWFSSSRYYIWMDLNWNSFQLCSRAVDESMN